MLSLLKKLRSKLSGELLFDNLSLLIYSTDASIYQERPLAVCIPRDESDIQALIQFAKDNTLSLIPRAAGTSLAGQVVGKGIVVDISKFFTQIIEINKAEKWVKVQPGVTRDDLNAYLKKFNLFFAPETSTANRAKIGGMIGNNSCGTNSIIYGTTREHLLEVKGFLSDGSKVNFTALSKKEVQQKRALNTFEGRIYKKLHQLLEKHKIQKLIYESYPDKNIKRRNTGYALDLLLENEIYNQKNKNQFNFCKLIAGSEGTLMFVTEAKLHLVAIPPPNNLIVICHFHSIKEALQTAVIVSKYEPYGIELIDHNILEGTKRNKEQSKNRFFVEGDPKAILAVELNSHAIEETQKTAEKLIKELKAVQLGYRFPIVTGHNINKIWNLRKAGLGLLTNVVGDDKPVAVIEDTAVNLNDLPDYIDEFDTILEKHNLSSVYYAHAGAGELHLRPILNLKTKQGNTLLKNIALDVATLVKKYNGSLSGEHGDGRLRGEFIPLMIGEECYQLLQDIKKIWDQDNIFNPNKIVNTPQMNESLRYMPADPIPEFETYFDFSSTQGLLRAAEQCSGSGDCRKSYIAGGTMCPSYMATLDEKHTTRARANTIRQVLTENTTKDAMSDARLINVLDLCLSCKGCQSECPANVDIAKLKAEILQQYYDIKGSPFSVKLMAHYYTHQKKASKFPKLYNGFIQNKFTSKIIKRILHIAEARNLPLIANQPLSDWFTQRPKKNQKNGKKIYIFIDEFTDLIDVEIGKKTIQLFEKLNYNVQFINHFESARTLISNGFLRDAKKIANKNVELFDHCISDDIPLIGIEPSAILSFRDEYPELVKNDLVEKAKQLAKNCFMFEEFIAKEFKNNKISSQLFTEEAEEILIHGHCHQKAISSIHFTETVCSIPKNFKVATIQSGCCGMAGSFGYTKQHYDISMKIGNMVLFPTIKKEGRNRIICANGTSCRHQIFDGTKRVALHPAEILFNALI